MALRLARTLWRTNVARPPGGAVAVCRRGIGSTVSDASLPAEHDVKGKIPEDDVLKPGELGEASGAPIEHLRRKVVIYSPSRTASQQGRCDLGKWIIGFDTTQKWENPLMGWTSTRDPLTSLSEQAMTFDSKEAAVDFARNQGWEYAVREPHQQVIKPKAYADNFKWKGLPVMGDEAET